VSSSSKRPSGTAWHRRSAGSLVRASLLVLAVSLALLLAGCGSSTAPPAGLVMSGPGLATGMPPWPPEYAHLAERLRSLGLPPGGKETVHWHALLHIYVKGLLVSPPANIGLEPAKHLESSLHTHDRTGIIHMESPYRYNFTLGDFFSVWGVKLGPAQLGGLSGLGGDKLHFYVNGKPLRNPAAYAMRNRDSIVIGYGAESEFPHAPSTFLLKEVEGKGGKALSCAKASPGHPATSCLTTQPTAKPAPARPSQSGSG
jgi:hypothetical protein